MVIVKVILFITFSTTWVMCTIAGINYMDSLNFKPLKTMIPGEDPCNPLYWYPRNIPEHCYQKTKSTPETNPKPLPVPVPLPLPALPFPYPMPIAPMYPMSPYNPIPLPPIMPQAPLPIPPPPIPMPMLPPPIPLPYGIPLAPTNPMLPVAGVPAFTYPSLNSHYGSRPQAGMVPGIPGLVSHDGGINILPFSDAYADLLEKHKQKMIRKKIQRVLNDYDDYPRNRRHRLRQYS